MSKTGRNKASIEVNGLPDGGEAWWMPFTANRDFQYSPRLLVAAEGHYYRRQDGEQVYDLFSGLWTSGLGHCHPTIVQAVQRQLETLDFAMPFQAGNDRAFELADRLCEFAPTEFNHCFFTNSGSESADTALKLALAYHHLKGESQRTILVGRERGYHGVNFGGLSVGGIEINKKAYSKHLIPGVRHLPDTLDVTRNAFSKGLPQHGIERADSLLEIIDQCGGQNIAAVMVEPVAGSTGVLPPPQGYLKRLRDICTEHDILLIFDEVITAFGRVGRRFATERFSVTPDIITTAKGLTNGVIPMGAVLMTDAIHAAFMQGPEHAVEWFHGYTYSGHPVAAAAGLATLDVYHQERSVEQARRLEPAFEEALHSVSNFPHVIDVRNIGLMGAIELAPRQDAAGARGLDAHKSCFWEENLIIRNGMDILQFAPFLNASEDDLFASFEALGRVLNKLR